MVHVGIILGSTRPGRNGAAVAQWAHDLAVKRGDAAYELVDLADFDLPMLDEPLPPARGRYDKPHTLRWATKIAEFDGYVFVTPEYNRSTSGALKNAIDYLYSEWTNKAAGFIGYGANGGTRAVEHLRLIMGELQIADVRNQVSLGLMTDFTDFRDFTPQPYQEGALNAMLDQLVAWSEAMRYMRAA